MLDRFNRLDGRVLIAFLARMLVGLLFLMAGFWKVFTLGVDAHTQNFFINGFKDHWIPDFMLTILGTSIPWFELIAGIALVLGFQARLFAFLCGLLLLLTTYGHALQQPLYDIDGHTFTRMILIMIYLYIPRVYDRLSVDFALSRGKSGQS